MVIRALILAMAMNSALAADDSGITPQMHDAHLPQIVAVTIVKSGVTSAASPESAEQCKNFKLSPQEIRAYIGKAGEVSREDYFHMLDWSPCSTSGDVTFKNGLKGRWTIQQYRAGSLELSTGRTLFLYCPQCRATKFPTADE